MWFSYYITSIFSINPQLVDECGFNMSGWKNDEMTKMWLEWELKHKHGQLGNEGDTFCINHQCLRGVGRMIINHSPLLMLIYIMHRFQCRQWVDFALVPWTKSHQLPVLKSMHKSHDFHLLFMLNYYKIQYMQCITK